MIGIFAAEGPNGNWIPGDPNELYWGSAAFLIIAAVGAGERSSGLGAQV